MLLLSMSPSPLSSAPCMPASLSSNWWSLAILLRLPSYLSLEAAWVSLRTQTGVRPGHGWLHPVFWLLQPCPQCSLVGRLSYCPGCGGSADVPPSGFFYSGEFRAG